MKLPLSNPVAVLTLGLDKAQAVPENQKPYKPLFLIALKKERKVGASRTERQKQKSGKAFPLCRCAFKGID
ncbi:hypothetical protein [Gilvimarinus xylanilyticus]|uniref:Uncharacterized protein n=1 Tax=Gilvimarinus xylanilyticus TaxID=2944139 RepID=A0A9X2I1J4_9GAMM|nr:hypothetical protein [Gilvimarinus xylanilyticus]MCP8898640.1 hypothetical protein [Gilvimarinus xylanilyticus]